MGDPNKWADRTAERLKQKADEKSRTDNDRRQEFVLRRKMLDEQAPQFWPTLRESFRQLSDLYNKKENNEILFFADIGEGVYHIRYKDTTGGWLVVERLPGHKISVLIDSVVIETYQVRVFTSGDGSVALVSSRGLATSVEQIAETSLEKFLGL